MSKEKAASIGARILDTVNGDTELANKLLDVFKDWMVETRHCSTSCPNTEKPDEQDSQA